MPRISLPWAAGLALLFVSPVHAASHLWVVNEIFSSPDGAVQFVELHVPSSAANEIVLTDKWIRSTQTGSQHTFTENLPPGSTAFAYLLLATQAFADLPGAPAPDHVVPSNFFDLDQDTITYWLYAGAEMGFASGELPLDGVTSLHRDGSTGPNSPTNFAGETGSVDADPAVAAPVIDGAASGLALTIHDGPLVGIEFEIPRPGEATLEIVDVSGRIVRRLYDGRAEGRTHVTWDRRDGAGRPVASAVYLVALAAGGERAVRKLTVMR